jgi:ABC-2 type transport system ATP-binding protein
VLSAFGKGQGEVTVEDHMRKLTVPVTGGAKLLAEVIRELDARGIEIDDIGLRRPTLDDVFLSLTGHVAEAKDEENGGESGEHYSKQDSKRAGKQGANLSGKETDA